MWTDPKTMLELAYERQRSIAREVDASRTKAAAVPAFNEVTHSWIVAVRTTGDYVRGLVSG